MFAANWRLGVRHQHRSAKVREEPDADWRVQVRLAAIRAGAVVPSVDRVRVPGGVNPVQHRQVLAKQPGQSFRSPDQQLDQQVGAQLFGDQRENRTR